MDYEQFKVESEKVWDVLDEKVLPPTLPDDIARLKELAATIEDPKERWRAEGRIESIEGILREGEQGKQEPWSDAMNEAIRVHLEATTDESGTVAERVARLDAAMVAIGRIADTAPPDEAYAIVEMNESLHMLMTALDPDAG
ncbi:hypothetical protein ACIA49_21015 [Kribbella sp. NPDC051587]|uniref:hypothetical protein n=1 Tax=Kribbella sp. NPDC051587 TaxID=3364119 RepID=UPI0037B460CD